MKTLNKTKKQIIEMTQKDFHNLLEINTDKNYHTENIVYIAYRYGNKKQILNSLNILNDHLKIGCMTPKLITKRATLLGSLLSNMLPTHKQTIMECL